MGLSAVSFRVTIARSVIIALCINFYGVSVLAAVGGSHPGATRGNFRNTLKQPGPNPDVNISTSATIFGGHVKTSPDANGDPVEPASSGYRLVQSAYGQMVARSNPYQNFERDAIDRAQKLLYYEKGDSDEQSEYHRELAAFRYKALLYSRSGNAVAAQFNTMNDFWGIEERQRADLAAALVRNALTYAPKNRALWDALLDIYYDIAVAEQTYANQRMVDVAKTRLGTPVGVILPPGEFLITAEIKLLAGSPTESIAPVSSLFEAALQPYFDLLKDPLGVNTSDVDSSIPYDMPFGYYIFLKSQPGRSLLAPSFKDTDGETKPVIADDGEPAVLYAGYKDLALLFEIQGRATQAAARLARQYALRSAPSPTPGDIQLGKEVVQQAQQTAYTDGSILDGVYETLLAAHHPPAPPQSGLNEARANWGAAIADLSGVKSFLEGEANPLGVDESFLGLVQTTLPGQLAAFNDSYNYFESQLLQGGITPLGPLGDAKASYDTAILQFEKWQQNLTAIRQDLQSQRAIFTDRLRQIVGSEYSEEVDDVYNFPFHPTNSGGEIFVQKLSIDRARLAIERNSQEIANLQQQIEHEIERRGKEKNVANLIADTYIHYGNKQARLTEEIAAINAVQQAANNVTSAINAESETGIAAPFRGVGANAYLINAAVQAGAELRKGELQAKKERLAAKERADVVYLNDRVADANSEARVKDLLLGMNTLAIESADAALAMQQEISRMAALVAEKNHLEKRYKGAQDELAEQWYANPAHRILTDQYLLEADMKFDLAQFWVFVMWRALEYKWNVSQNSSPPRPEDTPLLIPFGGKTYSLRTVFALRNAAELLEMVKAMHQYDAFTSLIGTRFGENFKKFSLREDFLGFKKFDSKGNKQYYPDLFDPTKRLEAEKAFQQYMIYIAEHAPPHVDPETGQVDRLGNYSEIVRVEFSTNRTSSDGVFFSPDRWDEKIKELAVKLDGGATTTQQVVYLEMAGTAYLRNKKRGVPGPTPDTVINEMTAYPPRFWTSFTAPGTGNNIWKSRSTFGFVIDANITTDPDLPPGAQKTALFHEMPPAVSKWVLEIPIRDHDNVTVIDLTTLRDVQIWFSNYYFTPRQN